MDNGQEWKRLVREHQSVLDRLPRTLLVNTLVELEKWAILFEPEKAYFRTLLAELAALDSSEFQGIFGGLKDFELRTGCDRGTANDPATLQAHLLNRLQREGHYALWRQEIDQIFQKLQPRIEERLYAAERRPRLVVLLYEEGIAIERDKLWKRFRAIGTRVPLKIEGAETREPFVHSLFTGQPFCSGALRAPNDHGGQRPPLQSHEDPAVETSEESVRTLFDVLRESQGFAPLDAWIIEVGDALHTLCDRSDRSVDQRGVRAACATGLSYERLRGFREQLSEAIYSKVLSGVRGPLELAAYIKNLRFTPREGVTLYSDEVVLAFIRDVFLAGSGTLIINNTFVEWAAVQALKRAQPRVLVARFGVRDKMKPFSSLLLFSKPRPTDQIPDLQDPLGSFVDAELLSYYVWLNAEEVAPYRDKTLYLLLADGVDEMLAVLPGSKKPASSSLAAATLPDVAATMAHWLGVALAGSLGRPILDF